MKKSKKKEIPELILDLTLDKKVKWYKSGDSSFRGVIKKIKQSPRELSKGVIEAEIYAGTPDCYTLAIEHNSKTIWLGLVLASSDYLEFGTYRRIWLLARNQFYESDIIEVLTKK